MISTNTHYHIEGDSMGKECFIKDCGYDVIIHEHHIIPLSEGGCECPENIIFLCPNHHGYVTHPKKHPIKSKKVEEQLPEGRSYHECEKCNAKWKSMQRVLDIGIELIGLEDQNERTQLRIEQLKLQIKHNFGMKEVLHRLMGFAHVTLDKLENHSEINKEKQKIIDELKGEGSGNQDNQGETAS